MGDTSAVNRGRSRGESARRPARAGGFDWSAPVNRRPAAPGLREAVGIWIVVGVLAIADIATYARVPVAELYHVSRGGLAGGASRVVTYLNYPVAFVAIALLGLAVSRVLAEPEALSRAGRWAVGIAAAFGLALCLVAVWPGVVNDDNLDARPINALPALGVALAAGLTVVAALRTGLGQRRPWSSADRARLAAVAVMGALALPWIMAIVGVYVGDVPLISGLFMSQQTLPGDPLPAVHLGEHHGLDGVFFAASSLMLMRSLGRVPAAWLRVPLSFYLGLMLAYGLANAGNDFSLEQVVKRGWATHELPSVLRPALTPAWGVILLATVIIGVLLLQASRSSRQAEG